MRRNQRWNVRRIWRNLLKSPPSSARRRSHSIVRLSGAVWVPPIGRLRTGGAVTYIETCTITWRTATHTLCTSQDHEPTCSKAHAAHHPAPCARAHDHLVRLLRQGGARLPADGFRVSLYNLLAALHTLSKGARPLPVRQRLQRSPLCVHREPSFFEFTQFQVDQLHFAERKNCSLAYSTAGGARPVHPAAMCAVCDSSRPLQSSYLCGLEECTRVALPSNFCEQLRSLQKCLCIHELGGTSVPHVK